MNAKSSRNVVPGCFHVPVAHKRKKTIGFAKTAEYQSGWISRDQLRRTGLTDTSIHRLSACGVIERIQPSVYRIAGGAETWLGRQHQGILWGGPEAISSHRSSAKLLGLEIVFDGVEITIPRRTRRPDPEIIVHYEKVCPEDVTEVHGLPCMKPARMLLTMGSVAKPAVVERVMAEALRKRMVTIVELADFLSKEGKRGVRGAGILRALLVERAGEALESELERRLWKIIKSSGLPLPQCQVAIGPYRVDFYYPDHRLIVEADSIAHHTSGPDFRRERERQNDLMNWKYGIRRFTWTDVTQRPQYVIDTIRKALSN